MKLGHIITTATIAGLFVSVPVYAANAKFAATYDTDTVTAAINNTDDPDDPLAFKAEHELATMKIAQWKEVLIGVSGQVNLLTFTQAKGKDGDGDVTAIAEGTVRLGVLVVPAGTGGGACDQAWIDYKFDPVNDNSFVAPGPVTFSSRHQELTVNNLNDEDVTVALSLETTASHHFNFVADDLTSGEYDIVACYDLSTLATGATANSVAAIGPRMLTIQEVRATKDGIVDETGASE